MKKNRKLFAGAAFVAVLAALGVVQGYLDKVAAQAKQVPRFEVDPYWPKPMPNNYVFGQTIGLGISSDDHVWVIHRGNDAAATWIAPSWRCRHRMARASASAASPAPPVMEFDAAGNNVGGWGGPVAGAPYQWPESNHGIVVDHKGFVWIGGNGQPDSHILKFTRDGKFVAQYGKPGARKDPASPADKPVYRSNSLDMDNFGRVAKIFIDPKANEGYVSDGYLNKRVAVIDLDSGKIKRIWGAYGEPPTDNNLGPYDPTAPLPRQFRNPMHCAEMSNDGLVYTCDRPNDRVQVFTKEGKFVQEYRIEPQTRSDGSVWDIAFSKDPQQQLPLHGRRRQRARSRLRPQDDDRALQLRLRRPPAGHVPRRAQHRRRLEGQHLHDGNLHRQAPAEVRLQGPRRGAEEQQGSGLAGIGQLAVRVRVDS